MDPTKNLNKQVDKHQETGINRCEENKDSVKKPGKTYKIDGTPCSYKGRSLNSNNK